VLSVSDTGVGIDEQTLKRIFEPFFTTKDVGKGTGMGLSMVHSIVHHSDGHILVESEPGEGTCFHLLFPPAEGARGDEDELREDAIPANDIGIGRHALIVDDESTIARFLSELMQNWGFETTVATDGNKALALLKSRPADFAVLITDQTMPGMTGVELARHVEAVNPALPVVICTGSVEQTVLLGKSRDHWSFLKKPVDIHALSAVIQRLLG
jgi:CheY-like chemotaxis protein